jgi:hypothetical protein
MKKVIGLSLLLLLLAACSADNNGSAEEVKVDTTTQVDEETEVENTANESEEQKELSVIKEHIDVDAYEMKVEEDNPHTRVMFFVDENDEKVYKTVLVKDTNRLKIIHLGDEGLLYNDTIPS